MGIVNWFKKKAEETKQAQEKQEQSVNKNSR